MSASVSICLTAYRRPKQLESTLESIVRQNYKPLEIIVVEDGCDGQTEFIAKRFGARYIHKPRPDRPVFQNPARAHNIGIRAAQNDFVILQGAEVRYTALTDIAAIVAPIVDDPLAVVSPCVQSLDENGNFKEWYAHPTESHRAGWIVNFCLGVRRERLLAINGFDESFPGYGFEDDFLMQCLRRNGARIQFAKGATVQHQWHGDRSDYNMGEGMDAGHPHFKALIASIDRGERPPIANIDKNWGQL